MVLTSVIGQCEHAILRFMQAKVIIDIINIEHYWVRAFLLNFTWIRLSFKSIYCLAYCMFVWKTKALIN